MLKTNQGVVSWQYIMAFPSELAPLIQKLQACVITVL